MKSLSRNPDPQINKRVKHADRKRIPKLRIIKHIQPRQLVNAVVT